MVELGERCLPEGMVYVFIDCNSNYADRLKRFTKCDQGHDLDDPVLDMSERGQNARIVYYLDTKTPRAFSHYCPECRKGYDLLPIERKITSL